MCKKEGGLVLAMYVNGSLRFHVDDDDDAERNAFESAQLTNKSLSNV